MYYNMYIILYYYISQGFTQDVLLGRGKNRSCEATAPGGLGVLPQEILKFRPSDVASGGFWGHRRLVAKI